MILLKLDCLKVNTKEELLMQVNNEFNKLVMSYLNLSESVDEYLSNNFDALWDCLSSFDFSSNPCMFIIYNFEHADSFLSQDQKNTFVSLFENCKSYYPNDFVYKIYDQDIIDEPKTITLEFIDLNK